ncbi:NAD(P)/FAD-dependent oxidoreductase [Periweissella beninensis]|uniref:NAD(P)/FAD-dependent oxidoreductase n=1 Tax=Periweissella beninensis TaxID=504936 RepID=UPI0021A348EE|nr:FAD-dependent oxidoreductase [Periweissella beninensis]MCT4395779.1 FAD-binding oxidoreductase [Periweissella beninensis]
MQRIGIIGGGIVGALTAYFLKEAGFNDITIFDRQIGQATAASAGIISPWLSKRRNQKWYHLANDGASLYPQIVKTAKITAAAYQQTGTIITRANSTTVEALFALAQTRKISAPMMQEIRIISADEIMKMIPQTQINSAGVYISGGARIDGAQFVSEVNKYTKVKYINESVHLTANGKIEGYPEFDKIIVATGAWLQETLIPLNYAVNVRPQKGQLIELIDTQTITAKKQPVLMPEGESDFIPLGEGRIIIGASHENDAGYDLKPTPIIKDYLLKSAQKINPQLRHAQITKMRVGTRAYTPDFAPFFGYLPEYPNIYVASGLGSSGLTTGPMIAKLLAELIINRQTDISAYTKPISEYIKFKN